MRPLKIILRILKAWTRTEFSSTVQKVRQRCFEGRASDTRAAKDSTLDLSENRPKKRHPLLCQPCSRHTCIYLHTERCNEWPCLLCCVQTTTAQIIFNLSPLLPMCHHERLWPMTENHYHQQLEEETQGWTQEKWKTGEMCNHREKIWGQTGGGKERAEKGKMLYVNWSHE